MLESPRKNHYRNQLNYIYVIKQEHLGFFNINIIYFHTMWEQDVH